MKVLDVFFDQVLLLEPEIYYDERGYFFESYNKKSFINLTGHKYTFVQDNQSQSSKGVIRGIHYQRKPFEQGKLVRVSKGSIFDVAVDFREESKTYLNYISVKLSDLNNYMLWIPRGFAHGFQALENDTIVTYKTDNFYDSKSEINTKFNDIRINVEWPIKSALLSKKDK